MENEFANELLHHPEYSPSRFPAWAACPHFEGIGDNANTRLGTELHKALSLHLCGNKDETMDGGLEGFVVSRAARTIQNELEAYFGDEEYTAESEQKLELSQEMTDAIAGKHVDIPMFGTADVAAFANEGGKIFIADFKSFFTYRDYTAQLAFYALALAEELHQPDDTHVRMVVVYGDREAVTVIDTTVANCYDYVKDAVDKHEWRSTIPAQSCAWCSLCAKCGSCTYAQDALAVEPFSREEVTVPMERLPFLLQLATEVEKRISALREYAKKVAKENGGYLTDKDGNACYTIRSVVKSTIDCWKLYELTRDKVSEEDFMLALSISKAKAEAMLKATGMKAKEAKGLIEASSKDPVEYETLAPIKKGSK